MQLKECGLHTQACIMPGALKSDPVRLQALWQFCPQAQSCLNRGRVLLED